MAYQVTATEGANSVNGILLRVKVLTGAAAAAAQTGATKIADTGISPFYDQSITTTVTGSVVYGAMADGNTAFSMTADARTTLIDNFADSTQGCQYVTFRATAATGTPGATILGATSPGGGEHGVYAAAEILAAGTIAEDASAPVVASTTAAKTIQSAAFTPPAGSLLVAMVSHCSSGVSSITITNNGGALTWRQLAYESTSGGTGSGVWVADVPAASPAGNPAPPLTVPGWIPGAPGMPGGEAFTSWPPLPKVAPGPDPAPPPGTEPPPPPLPLPPAFPGLGLPGMPGGTAFGPWPPPAQEVSSPPLPAVNYITGLAGTGAGYFVDERGNPRMVLGDAVWGLPGNVGRWSSGAWAADYDAYFATRGGQGFTAAYCKPMGTTQSGNINDDGRTFDGLFPFAGGSLANPSTGLTAAYWARIDYMLASALAQGITVFLNAIGYDSDFTSAGPLAGKSAGEFQSYGAQLGARYAAQPNLIWMVADDYFGGSDTLISAFLTGLRGAGDTHPISIENYPETTSRQDLSTSSALPWGAANGQFNFCYSYNVTYFGVEKAFLEASPICPIQGDGYFYQGGSSYAGGSGAFAFDRAVRQDAWHAISSGARGIIHGDEACWQWQTGAQAAAAANWYQVHNAGNIRTLLESLPSWQLLIPDTSSALVTAGRGTHASGFSSGGGGGQYEVAFTDSYVTASRTPSGDLAVIYLSHATSITIDQSQMVAGYAAYWVDPITGAKTATTAGSSYNSATPGNNSQGDPDWVLVLQAATSVSGSASLSGTGTLTASPLPGSTAALTGAGTLSAAPQLAATAALTGAGTLSAGPSLTGTAALSGSGTLTAGPQLAASASLSGAGTLSVSGVILGTTASLSGTGTLSVSGVTLGTAAALAGTGTLSAAPQLAGTASLSGLGTLTASAALAGTAALSGSGTLTAGPQLAGAASLSGSGTLSASPQLAASASLSGSGTLSAAWALGITAALSGAGTLAVAGVTLGTGAALSGAGTLSASPQFAGTAALSGSGTLSALWALGAAVALSGTGTLSYAQGQATAALSGAGTLSAAPALTGAVALSGAGTLTAGPLLAASAALAGAGTLTAGPVLTAVAALSGSGTLSAAPAMAAGATLAGTGTLTAAGALTLAGAAFLSGLGTLAVMPQIRLTAALSGTGVLTFQQRAAGGSQPMFMALTD